MTYLYEIIRLGLKNIKGHSLRSFLTILGVLFGVWSVIAMLTINESIAKESKAEIEMLGSSNIIIETIKPSDIGSPINEGRLVPLEYGITYEDIQRIKGSVPNIKNIVKARSIVRDILYKDKTTAIDVIGTEPVYFAANNLKLLQGRIISELDRKNKQNICVITDTLEKKLFAPANSLKKSILVDKNNNTAFTVVGVVKSPSGEDTIFIPDAVELQRFGYSTLSSQGSISLEKIEVSKVILQMEDEDAVLRASPILRELMSRYHSKQDYKITVPQELLEQKQRQSRLWNIMFIAIASISLLVGGIGIMNIMLSSVTERIREIGVRRALGARKVDIIILFLVESIILTFVGGVLGIIIGAFAIPLAVSPILTVPASIQISTLIVPFIMAILTGVISGIYPAFRASNLNPITAIRHE